MLEPFDALMGMVDVEFQLPRRDMSTNEWNFLCNGKLV